MSKQQTAVEWLEKEISTKLGTNDLLDDLYKQAKAMEKEQIERAWMDAEINLPTEASARAFARKYYEQTYSNDRQYNQYTIDYER